MSASRRHRGSKYCNDEDVAICKAVVAISEDGETDAAQKKDKYWERIFNKFVALYGNREGRNPHGINNRFCIVSKEVLKYVDILKHFHKTKPSSWTELDVVSHARKEYESREKRVFAFDDCYEILLVLPKYNVHNQMTNMQTSQEEGGGSNPVTPTDSGRNVTLLIEGDQTSHPENNISPPEPTAYVQRPPGYKAQKRAKKSGPSLSTSLDSMVEETSSFINCFKEGQVERKLERARQNEAMESFVRLKQKEIDLKEKEEEDRIMAVDIGSMSEGKKRYWEARQQEILNRRGLL